MPFHIPAATINQIKTALDKAKHILVITHIAPDGDALGSLTAVGLALDQLKKKHTLVCDDGTLERFNYLALTNSIKDIIPTDPIDLVISVDCADASRMGKAYDHLPSPKPFTINIDHHITNTNFGNINLVISEAKSTTEILADLFPHLQVNLSHALATSLLTGLVTDTLCFRIPGVTASTLGTASRLIEAGANLFDVTTQGLLLRPLSTLKLWQIGLNNMREENGFVWTTISYADRDAIGLAEGKATGLVNALSDTYQAYIGAVLWEQADGTIIVSFRCHPPYTVSELAVNLGGGGHDLAAGCTIDGPLNKAEQLVIDLAKANIRKQQGIFYQHGHNHG
ncbi:MAG TPA: bifunctional oligoribonuclease/PAP phosphatase NrnA [Anaerolineae bacterium]|nr:bifunctional oligoribonuclease/PAP phosphatase NrnA [Anaerolineae bacterium]